jgi:hypothetical protein
LRASSDMRASQAGVGLPTQWNRLSEILAI